MELTVKWENPKKGESRRNYRKGTLHKEGRRKLRVLVLVVVQFYVRW